MPENQFCLSIQAQIIPLTYNTQLTRTDIPELQSQNYDGVVAQVNSNPKNPAILGLKNCSTQTWQVTLPKGDIRQIETGQTIKLERGTKIYFGLVRATILISKLAQEPSIHHDSRTIDTASKDKQYIGKKIVAIIGLIFWSILIYLLENNFFVVVFDDGGLRFALYIVLGVLCSLALWRPKLAQYYDALFIQLVGWTIPLAITPNWIFILLTCLSISLTISLRFKHNKSQSLSVISWSVILVWGTLLSLLFLRHISTSALIITATFYTIESLRLENQGEQV